MATMIDGEYDRDDDHRNHRNHNHPPHLWGLF
jgi:hypothetical protein